MKRHKRLPAEPFEVEISEILGNGRGVAVHDDRTLQVHGALAGETVMARYLFGRRFRGQAETVKVIEASPERIEPRCVHFGTCSACSLQHLLPESQVRFKQQLVLAKLKEMGGLEPEEILAPLQADAWHYRRKARLSVRYVEKKGGVLVGFRERDGRFVTQMSECHVLPRRFVSQLDALQTLLNGMDAARHIPQIELCCGDRGVALVFRHLEPLSREDQDSLRGFSRETGFGIYLQAGGPDSVAALEGCEAELVYELPEFGLTYPFGPLDFIQVNATLNRAMVSAAVTLLDAGEDDHVLDLFCGLGNFSLPIAKSAASVTGFEGDTELVRRAAHNAGLNGIGNVNFIEAGLYGENPLGELAGRPFSHVLLDPPRSGAAPVLSRIAQMGARRIVYVSCNPDTLASDAGLLVHEHGFTLKAAGVMDMFPHTTHIESMALFVRD